MRHIQYFKSEAQAWCYYHAFSSLQSRNLFGVDADGVKGRLYVYPRKAGGFWAEIGA